MNTKKAVIILGIVGLALWGYSLYLNSAEKANAGELIGSVDFLGTGTSTAGSVNFGLTTATTTTGVALLEKNVDTLTFEIYPEAASTTGSFSIQILGSSLDRCAQSGGNNQNWVDAVSTNSVSGAVTTINSATSTIVGSLGSSKGVQYTLQNVNFRCVKAYVGGHKANMYIKMNKKSLSSTL